MDKKNKNGINRRDFVTSGTIAVVAANYLGLERALAHAAPARPLVILDVADIMKAAAAGVLEINQFFKRSADEIERMKEIKAAAIEKNDCAKVLSIIASGNGGRRMCNCSTYVWSSGADDCLNHC